MDLIKIISRLFNEQAEEVNRIVIITKNTSKDEIKKFERELKQKENAENKPKNQQPGQ